MAIEIIVNDSSCLIDLRKCGLLTTALLLPFRFIVALPLITAELHGLANQTRIKVRIQELADTAAKLAGIDAAWAMVLLKGKAEANLDDYLSPPDGSGTRFFDLTDVPREKIGHLSELQIEDETDKDDRRILKTKLKLCDPVSAIGLMAKIAGWLAPAKVAATDRTGEHDAGPITVEIVRFSDAKNPIAA